MLLDDQLLLLGIRHHGPGCAASVRQALRQFQPDIVLVEGAPEAEPLLHYLANNNLQPPVAQLIYAVDDPSLATFYPFAEFSPEWQALLFSQRQDIACRFFDLPMSHSLALDKHERQLLAESQAADDSDAEVPESERSRPSETVDADDALAGGDDAAPLDVRLLGGDPLDALAQAAGYQDGERWWELMVEQHPQNIELFSVIGQAMTELREALELHQCTSIREQRREAWMRRQIRQAQKDGFERIAVVCGAWHVPALVRKIKLKDDNPLLKGLPKLKLQATWVPWSYGRISQRSGYGAGVAYPGWYHHLWQQHVGVEQAEGELCGPGSQASLSASWLSRAARCLREQGVDVAPASVIEAVRLADTLAVLRQRSLPSLEELNEAIQTLFCFGDPLPMQLLNQQLMIGERLGQVPAELPKVPLQEDLQRQIKRLRLKTEAVEKTVQLDLRKDIGRQRSVLFHRLQILSIDWAQCLSEQAGKGTFKEVWQLQWQPEFELKLIEHSGWGNQLQQAAGQYALHCVRQSQHIGQISQWLDRLIVADLPQVLTPAIDHLQQQAAVGNQLEQLMQALPSLVNLMRYGDVRGTQRDIFVHLIDGFASRICIGLLPLCKQQDDDSAQDLLPLINQVTEALNILENDGHLRLWWQSLQRLAEYHDMHGVMAGAAYRLLLNGDQIDVEVAARALAFALSRAEEPLHAAHWLEGLLQGSGLLLVHDDRLWSVVDQYISQLPSERFEELLPLLRRTFASFSDGERHNIFVKASHSHPDMAFANHVIEPDEIRMDVDAAAQMLPLLQTILGLPASTGGNS